MSCLWNIPCEIVVSSNINDPDFKKSLESVQADGQFDATIACAGYAWNVHLNVMCGRSPQLNNWFKGGQIRYIQVDCDPMILGHAIFHMYYGKLDASILRKDDEAFANLAKLWLVGWGLKIPSLLNACLKLLKELLKQKVICYQYNYTRGIALTTEEMAGFKAGVQFAYEQDIKLMKQFFVYFVEDTHYWISKEEPFQKILAALPQFAADISKAAGVSDCGRIQPMGIPSQCMFCSETQVTADNHWAAMLEVDNGMVGGSCFKCWEWVEGEDYDQESDEA